MLLMFDNSGNRVLDWKLGRKFSLPKNVDAADVTAMCADGLELEFITGAIAGLTFPKNYGAVWWYAGTAKTVASILDSHESLELDSESFLQRKRKINSAKKKVGMAIDKIKEFNPANLIE